MIEKLLNYCLVEAALEFISIFYDLILEVIRVRNTKNVNRIRHAFRTRQYDFILTEKRYDEIFELQLIIFHNIWATHIFRNLKPSGPLKVAGLLLWYDSVHEMPSSSVMEHFRAGVLKSRADIPGHSQLENFTIRRPHLL